MKHTIIFVHGFGVMKDARGMFTEISNSLASKDINCVLVDLNKKDNEGNVVLNTFNGQIDILKKTFISNDDRIIDLICHSQGCIIAALADLPNIRKTIFLAPPTESDNKKTIDYFSNNILTTIDIHGISKLARRDGTFTIVPKEYWQDKEKINLEELYKAYISHNDVQVISATLDEVISNEKLEKIFTNNKILNLEANHDFTGNGRSKLIQLCSELVSR